MNEIDKVAERKFELLGKIEEIQKELELIDELKLDSRNHCHPDVDFTMFCPIRNEFFYVGGYNLEEDYVVLWAYTLNPDYVEGEKVEMWDISHLSVPFKEYEKKYLPLFECQEEGFRFLSFVSKTREKNLEDREECL